MNTRLLAARIVEDVVQGHSLTQCLENYLPKLNDARDRAFVQAMTYGVCRYFFYLDVLLSHLLQKPMREKDSDVHALLLVGLYQLIHMRIPPHAAVAETVNAVQKKPWARGLINAVLREYLRQKEALEILIKTDEEACYSHPAWLIAEIKEEWPAAWQAILFANNQHPPFALRVNQQLITRANYLKQLQELNIEAAIIPETKNGIVLAKPLNVEELPGFNTGMISVQDGAAQLAAEWLDLAPNHRVLDACAAPGGKLMHILEQESQLAECVAVEIDSQRMNLIQKNLARQQKEAQCYCADVGDVKKWWDGKLFDRILLDAPCSATGVIRRHPDIKLLRQPNDIAEFAKEQLRLLQTLWPLLKPGGLLLYVTCSILPQENVEVMQQFLTQHQDAKEEMISADWGVPCAIGRQILPDQLDGFYYARVWKIDK